MLLSKDTQFPVTPVCSTGKLFQQWASVLARGAESCNFIHLDIIKTRSNSELKRFVTYLIAWKIFRYCCESVERWLCCSVVGSYCCCLVLMLIIIEQTTGVAVS